MTLSSMTGFARADGVSGAYHWAWELKSVNAKGFELRLRLPPGWDSIEPSLRGSAAKALSRGTVHANLSVQRAGVPPVVRVNEAVLAAVIATMNDVAKRIDTDRQAMRAQLTAMMNGITVDEAYDQMRARIPAGRLGRPDELGDACAFLCGDRAGFITGQNLQLDGGAYAGLF